MLQNKFSYFFQVYLGHPSASSRAIVSPTCLCLEKESAVTESISFPNPLLDAAKVCVCFGNLTSDDFLVAVLKNSVSKYQHINEKVIVRFKCDGYKIEKAVLKAACKSTREQELENLGANRKHL